jgi:D-lactate dehydrogenase
MSATAYEQLHRDLQAFIPASRLITDPLRTLAYGTDGSLYRLIPKLVVKVDSEEEMRRILALAHQHQTPVTFRAAGTSLSGQAVTDSVLLQLGDGWRGWKIGPNAATISLQPGLIGGHANRYLAPYQRKIGPDPASINTCQIGGIAANNASGMCCGTAQNSYQTLNSMRVMLADGAVLDTGDAASRAAFRASHGALLDRLAELSQRTRTDATLAERIRNKFKIKNTCGYSLNALVDYEDPFEILQHLMIGSEGTLGFIAEITYRTVEEHSHKATALMIFPDIQIACEAVAALKSQPVAAVELMDRASIRSVENKAGMPDYFKTLPETAAALLVETRAMDAAKLAAQVEVISAALTATPTLLPFQFTDRPEEFTQLWAIRQGLFPSVGSARATGTTVIIEDVAVPVPQLAAMTLDLQRLFDKHGYTGSIIFGHALEGNLHFVITPNFANPAETERYKNFMDDVCQMIVQQYDGSLKAEHGTGRNIAPFVELEWGQQAYQLMRDIKALLDPQNLLNPGVILNDDPEAHLKNIKPMAAVDPLVDKCIECGFCEPNCPSRALTLSPRQRIVGLREMARLRAAGEDASRLQALSDSYQYQGIDTCAADSLCSLTCPVGINTGTMMLQLRARDGAARWGRWVGEPGGRTIQRRHRRDALRPGRGESLAPAARQRCATRDHRRGSQAVGRPTAAVESLYADRGRTAGGGQHDPRPTVRAWSISPVAPAAAWDPPRAIPKPTPCRSKPPRCCAKPDLRWFSRTTATRCVAANPSPAKACRNRPTPNSAKSNRRCSKPAGTVQDPIVIDTSPCSLRLKRNQQPLGLKVYDITEFLHDAVLARLTAAQAAGNHRPASDL